MKSDFSIVYFSRNKQWVILPLARTFQQNQARIFSTRKIYIYIVCKAERINRAVSTNHIVQDFLLKLYSQ